MDSSNHRPVRKILHTADLHLLKCNDRGCKALETVINLSISKKVDLILIAGDFFDETRNTDSLLDFVREQICRVSIPIVILPGNHDCLVPKSVYAKKEYWQEFLHVHILRQSGGETLNLPDLNICIWGKPIDTYYDVLPLQGMPQPEKNGSWNIVMAHGMVVKTIPDEKRAYIITEDELNSPDWDYMALGHIPRFQLVCNKPIVCYSGSPKESNTVALVDLSEESGVQVTCIEV
jgi:exonuclease SbcD